MSERSITKAEAESMALSFLRDNGPHTMGPVEDEGALAAALTFLDLTKAGMVTKTDFGDGRLQFSISATGLRALSPPAPTHPPGADQ